MAGTYDEHADEAARVLGCATDDAGDPLFREEDVPAITIYLATAQVRATLALAAAVRELVVATTLPVEALDAIRQKITDPADKAWVGYSRGKNRRPPADPPAEDLTTPTQ